MAKLPDQPIRVTRAFVVLEMTDGSTVAYALNQPENVVLESMPIYATKWNHASTDMTFKFDRVPYYKMVWLDPSEWRRFNFDALSIEAGESDV